jgi:hypothetical protein
MGMKLSKVINSAQNNATISTPAVSTTREEYEIQLRIDTKDNPSIEDLAKTYGIPKNITNKSDSFCAKSYEEDCWLMGGNGQRRQMFTKRIQWDKATVFTYECENLDEIVWKIIKYE